MTIFIQLCLTFIYYLVGKKYFYVRKFSEHKLMLSVFYSVLLAFVFSSLFYFVIPSGVCLYVRDRACIDPNYYVYSYGTLYLLLQFDKKLRVIDSLVYKMSLLIFLFNFLIAFISQSFVDVEEHYVLVISFSVVVIAGYINRIHKSRTVFDRIL